MNIHHTFVLEVPPPRFKSKQQNAIQCTAILLAHSKNELMQWRGVRRLSVCLSVNFCANRFFSQTNGRIATKLAHDGLVVKVKGHVIRALFWILGMSSVIDGLVFTVRRSMHGICYSNSVCPSVRLSVRPSVTLVDCVHMV